MRVLLTMALVLAATRAAFALPFTGDARCPNANVVALQLQQKEASAPQTEPSDYVPMAQAYQKCMQDYATAGNTWQALYAGTTAMQWAAGGATLLSTTNPAQAQSAYALVHSLYTFMQPLGIDYVQIGTQWQTLDTIAREKLGIK